MIAILIDKSKTERNCRFLDIDPETAKKLKPIRHPNVFEDDLKLICERDLPQHQKPLSKDIVVTSEMRERAEAALQYHLLYTQAGKRPAPATTPEPAKPMTFEEQLAYDWRTSPSLRKEFINFGTYAAYMRAEKAGRARVFGRHTS